jgi:sulfur carrier protein ThiS
MLRVRVVPHGRLAKNSRISSEGQALTMPAGSRIRDVLIQVGLFDEEVKRVMVNGRRARLDTAVRRDDLIELHP